MNFFERGDWAKFIADKCYDLSFHGIVFRMSGLQHHKGYGDHAFERVIGAAHDVDEAIVVDMTRVTGFVIACERLERFGVAGGVVPKGSKAV